MPREVLAAKALHQHPQMPKVNIYFKLYTGDYLKDTMHFTREEHGSYDLLMIAYYNQGEALDDDDRQLARIAKCPWEEWPQTRAVLSKKFQIRDGKWFHKRVQAEILKAQAESDAKSQAAKDTNAKRSAQRGASRPESESELESESESKTKATSSEYSSKGEEPALEMPAEPDPRDKFAKPDFQAGETWEENLIRRCFELFGQKEMARNTGIWVLRAREDRGKLDRVLAEIKRMQKEGLAPRKTWGATATNLWQTWS